MESQGNLGNNYSKASNSNKQISYILADNFCFECKKINPQIQCSNCPRLFHQSCFNTLTFNKSSSNKPILCKSCSFYNICTKCQQIIAPLNSLNQKSIQKLVCNVCHKSIHYQCSKLVNKVDHDLFKGENPFINQFICESCLFVSGIHVLVKKIIFKQYKFWLVNPFNSSSIHCGWLSDSMSQQIIQTQYGRPTNNLVERYEQQTYTNNCKIDKIIKVKIPLIYLKLNIGETIQLIFNPNRNLQYGSINNFKFLVKWDTLPTEMATWEDQYPIMKIGRNKVQDYFKYLLYVCKRITIGQVRRSAYSRYFITNKLDSEKQQQFVNNKYYLMNATNPNQTNSSLIALISRFYCLNSESKPTIFISNTPDRWYELLKNQSPHLRVGYYMGKQTNRLCQFQNELFCKKHAMFDILIVSFEFFLIEYQKITRILYDLIVLDCENELENFSQSFWKLYKSAYKIIRYYKTSQQKLNNILFMNQSPEVKPDVCIENRVIQEQQKVFVIEQDDENQISNENQVQSVFEQHERLLFLRFILAFGYNIQEPQNILLKLIEIQEPNPIFSNTPQYLARLKKYIKQFITALNNPKRRTKKIYFQDLSQNFISDRICNLMVVKKAYNDFHNRHLLFPIASRFQIAITNYNGKTSELFSHAWKSKDDIELMRLVLKYGYQNWRQICEQFHKQTPGVFVKGYIYLVSILWPEIDSTGSGRMTIERLLELRTGTLMASKQLQNLVMQ